MTEPFDPKNRYHVGRQAGKRNDEIYTPEWVFERLGLSFDMDVAGPEGGLSYIPAKTTLSSGSLEADWEGRIWMNPPYSRLSPWTRKFIKHGHGVALVCISKSKANTELFASAAGIVVPDPFPFRRPDGTEHNVFSPILFAAFGDECVEAISNLGAVRKVIEK